MGTLQKRSYYIGTYIEDIMNTLKINTTDQELHDAYLLMDKGRGKQVSIRRDQLVHLALDHTAMVRALEKLGVRVVAADSNTHGEKK